MASTGTGTSAGIGASDSGINAPSTEASQRPASHRLSHGNSRMSLLPMRSNALPAPILPTPEFDAQGMLVDIANFRNEFDGHIQGIKVKISDSAEQWDRRAGEVQGSHQKLQEELRVAIAEEAALAKALDKEKEEASNMTKTVQQLSARYEELRQTRSHLENQIITLQKEVTAKRDAKIALKKALDEQTMKNKPELAAYEATLGLRIVGVKEDHIGFVFTRLNELDWDKEYSITIDVSQYDFAVSECTPNLPELSSLLQHLNETRDFYGFLKRARKAFKDLPNK